MVHITQADEHGHNGASIGKRNREQHRDRIRTTLDTTSPRTYTSRGEAQSNHVSFGRLSSALTLQERKYYRPRAGNEHILWPQTLLSLQTPSCSERWRSSWRGSESQVASEPRECS